MSLSHEFARLNLEGVQCLLNGHLEVSVQSFSKSVVTLKALCKKHASAKTGMVGKTASIETSLAEHLFSTVELGKQNSDNLFFFNQAFLIPELNEVEINTIDIRVYSSVIIFNLALAFHLLYINSTSDNSCYVIQRKQSFLNRAKMFYGMASSVLGHEVQTHGSCMGWIVQLAIISNLSYLARVSVSLTGGSDLDNTDGMTRAALRYLSTNRGDLFENPKFQGLLLNVLFLDETPAVAAAA